jgi:hypothetical protein
MFHAFKYPSLALHLNVRHFALLVHVMFDIHTPVRLRSFDEEWCPSTSISYDTSHYQADLGWRRSERVLSRDGRKLRPRAAGDVCDVRCVWEPGLVAEDDCRTEGYCVGCRFMNLAQPEVSREPRESTLISDWPWWMIGLQLRTGWGQQL